MDVFYRFSNENMRTGPRFIDHGRTVLLTAQHNRAVAMMNKDNEST